jgi:ribosomal-protein-alanine N-acetyltransferase
VLVTNEISIRLAKLGDAPRIARMSRTLVEAGLPWTWTARRVAEHMKQRENLAVIAAAGGELAGFAMAQFGSQRVHLALLCVAEHRRRQGLGRRLVHWVEETAVTAGLFELRLEVRESNRAAQRFYASLGYKPSGAAALYYSGIENAIRYTRDLSCTASRDH